MNDNDGDEIEAMRAMVEGMSACLVGKGSRLQGAALADLTAMWVAGHVLVGAEGDAEATDKLRENLLALHIELIRKLIPVNALEIQRKMGERR